MKPKILIADDDNALLASMTVRLSAEGYEVLCAHDGYQAVEQARKHCPFAVILDVNMPAGDGFSVQDRLDKMQDFVGMPVIYLTGERSQRVERLANIYQAFAVIYKPFESEELVNTVKAALEASRSSSAA